MDRIGSAIGFAVLVVAAFGTVAENSLAGSNRAAGLYTNEQWINALSAPARLDITNSVEVFRFVFSQLPKNVTVYPTENYYYFRFYHGGVEYAGNMRFAPELRDEGKIYFIYFKATSEWLEEPKDNFVTIGPGHGVTIKKSKRLVYTVELDGKEVVFQLNDLSAVRPPDGLLRKAETFLGPVFDESGIRFFLLFDHRLKQFHYVLDETVPVNDELVKTEGLKQTLIGRRTGFAYYTRPGEMRKTLVGVFGPNAQVNNYYDGPFDQLPDNFIKGNALRDAIKLADPEYNEPMDRLGNSLKGESRYLIAPYMDYQIIDELAAAEKCAISKKPAVIYSCFKNMD